MKASIVVPTWNGAATLEGCLRAVFAQEAAFPFDVLVVDSSSTDRTRDIASSFPVRLRVIDQRDFDHGDTRNLGAALTDGDLIVFLVQDAEPADPHWLSRLAANFEEPSVAGAFSRIVPRPDASPLVRRGVAGDLCFGTERIVARVDGRAAWDALDPLARRLLINFNDVASCVRRSVWRTLPLPRAAFGEDLAWSMAALLAGHAIVFDPASVVVHSHDYDPATIRSRTRTDARWNREWLGRLNVARRRDVVTLTRRAVAADRAFLRREGYPLLDRLRFTLRSARYHLEEYRGFREGGRTDVRREVPRPVPEPSLKVLFVLHSFPPETTAGTEVLTLTLARALRQRGHEVVVLHRSADPSLADLSLTETSFDGFRVIRLAHQLRHASLREAWIQPAVDRLFRDVLRAERPHVVHFEHLIHLSASLPRVARDEGIASVVTLNDYWFRCPRVQLVRGDGVVCEGPPPIGGCAACVHDKPGLVPLLRSASRPARGLVHGAAGAYLRRWPRGALAGHAHLVQRPADMLAELDQADLVIAPSRFLKEKMVEAGFPAERLIVSDYGMETAWLDEYRPRDPDGRLRLGFVGSLVPWKGPLVLADAFARLGDPRAELHVHGDDASQPLFQEVADAVRRRAPGAVLHGAFAPREIARVLSSIDVLVVPSTWFENSPLTIHEALQARMPVVVSDQGGMRELVAEGQGGLRFRPGDPEDLARVLRRLVDEPGLAQRLGARAPEVKTAEENAVEMEVRYRQVIGLAWGRRSRPGAAG